MTILLILSCLFGSFVQKWYLDRGITGGTRGRIMICDTDRDSQIELIFAYYENLQEKVVIYELYPDSTFYLEAIIDTMSGEAWDIGDFDGDGLYDLVLTGDFGLPVVGPQIYESPDSFSYPTQEVWRDTAGFPLVTPICTYDIDQDGLPEIVKVIGDTTDFDIYEAVDNNLYTKIYRDTILESHSPKSTIAFGDFDLDGQNEFVIGYTGGEYSIWECVGDNTYQEITLQQLSTLNIADCFSVPDADGDGKLEFVVKGFIVPTGEINVFIFEAISNDTYEIIQSFNLTGGTFDYYGGYSEAGDVDGDSVPEIVLESASYVYIIKAAGNDSFYVWDTLPGHASGSNVRVTDDIDGNGLNEIVVSGNNETRIYEYEPGGVEEYASGKPVNIGFTCLSNVVENDIHLSFTLPQQTQVSLSIYNNLGQRVKNIFTGMQSAGRHSQKIDLTAFAAGVYFIQLTTSDETITQKVVKIR